MEITNEMMAEVQGWECRDIFSYLAGEKIKTWYAPNNDGRKIGDKLPYFTHDLNLVHDIEAGLTDEEWMGYFDNLNKLAVSVAVDHFNEHDWNKALRHADALTCCEALYPILKARIAA